MNSVDKGNTFLNDAKVLVPDLIISIQFYYFSMLREM